MKTGNYPSVGRITEPAALESAAVPRASHEREQQRSGGKMQRPSIGWQMTMLTTLAVSILASRFIDYYRAAIVWSPFRDWQYLVFALIISVTIFPLVYRKAQRSQHDPVLVQLGVIFAGGIGWEKLLSTTASLVKPLH